MIHVEEKSSEHAKITLSGNLHSEEVQQLRESVLAVARKHPHIEFDLAQVSSVDSSAIGLVLAVRNLVVPEQGAVVVTGLQGKVRKVFQLANLSQVLTIRD